MTTVKTAFVGSKRFIVHNDVIDLDKSKIKYQRKFSLRKCEPFWLEMKQSEWKVTLYRFWDLIKKYKSPLKHG